MKKYLQIIFLLLASLMGQAQSLDGKYIGLELNDLVIDTSGKLSFYGMADLPHDRNFHEVVITIKGNSITIEKSPVIFDTTGIKIYSASDGGFLTYKGELVKNNSVYHSLVKLVDHEYSGFSTFDPPTIDGKSEPVKTKEQLMEEYDHIERDGRIVYFTKGTVQLDLVIRPVKNGIRVNNILYVKK